MKPPRLSVSRLATTSSSPYICKTCRLTCRKPIFPAARFSSTLNPLNTSTKTNPPPPPPAGYTSLSSRRMLSISGPDAAHYLQGVITANLSPSTSWTGGFYAAFLNAQGRLLNDVFIYPNGEDGWLIEVDANDVETLANHVKRYKLRAKFEVRVLEPEEVGVWSLWGTPGTIGEGRIGCEDKRVPEMGRRLILPGGEKPEVDADEASEDAYKIRRYLMGVPEGQSELIRGVALPQESNIDYMGGIDYKKGCYVGQELTIRTHHRGVVRKRVLPVMVYPPDDLMPDSLKYDPTANLDVETIPALTSFGTMQKKGRDVGKWLAGVGNIGLALCRLETMTNIQLTNEPSKWKRFHEFKVEWDIDGKVWDSRSVRVKAFVPPWHLKRQPELHE